MADAGETIESLAHQVGVDPKTAARWLSPGRTPHPRTRLRVATLLDRKQEELWPEPYRRRNLAWFRPWAEIERMAILIRSYQPLVLQGLLQTENYARAMLRVGSVMPPEEVEELVEARLQRQAILSSAKPPQFIAVFDEMVLRRRVGDRAVMREQLEHLITIGEQEHVQIQVIPADAPWHTGLAGPFVVGTMPDGTEAGHLDNQLRGQMVDLRADLVSLGRRWESVTGEALPRRHSIELIKEVAKTWT
ncbi:Scr1 family TA system antitoxin-like transcriptional regulator [Micromonospora sp. NPDC050417]|uniref:Scr1 family TA system antitoxin-like transcriptional regulator n=1 Tax=Micromonospora sp. NPDC050417 TaxID=3364280 RepID=UPI0037888C42